MGLSQDGDQVLLLVDDDGSGIPAGQQEAIFERFVRLDEVRSRDAGGSGPGLAIVREATEDMAGTVTVGDAPGRRGAVHRDAAHRVAVSDAAHAAGPRQGTSGSR